IGSARTVYRDLVESPQTFGSMQKSVQEAIKTLLAVSDITSQYLKEGRFDGDLEQQLMQLTHECRSNLAELQSMGEEFETMDTRAFRQDDLRNLTESLDDKVKSLEDINGRVNVSALQLEKSLQKYIAQVKGGDRASSIISSVSSSSITSPMGHKEWRLIQKELESVGITAAQFTANREKVLRTLSDAFQEDVEGGPPVETKKAGQLTRLLSALSNRSGQLLVAAEEGHIKEARNLLAKKAYIDTENSKGLTPLILAVRERNFELTELFLSYKADVHKIPRAVRGGTHTFHLHGPLGWAVHQHDVAIIDLLLDHGALINHPRYGGMTLLHDAVPYDNIDIINTLIDRGADISAESFQYPGTVLGMAIEHRSLRIVETLVKHGCNVNRTFEDEAPLSLAISEGGIDITRYLVQHGAHVEMNALLTAARKENIQHLQFLLSHYKKADGLKADLSRLAVAAIRVGNEDALSLLVEKGADINARCKLDKVVYRKGGQTLVWLAAAGGHHRSLDLLLAKGADIEKRAYPEACKGHQYNACLLAVDLPDDCTATQIAISHGHWDCVRLLAHHGGDLNDSVHPVIKAQWSAEERLQNLLDIGADPNVEAPNGTTPLHIVSSAIRDPATKLNMARILVAKGARVNCQTRSHWTPLHITLRKVTPDYQFVEFLLNNGADPTLLDCDGRTPLHYHQRRFTSEIKDALARAGAPQREMPMR
ncbi:MAG: hypothetical protein Q9183_003591, partial [Haloplaca sp. 2 TL-2023]